MKHKRVVIVWYLIPNLLFFLIIPQPDSTLCSGLLINMHHDPRQLRSPFWEYIHGNKVWSFSCYTALSCFELMSSGTAFLGSSVLSLKTKRNIKWACNIAITGSVQQVERCSHPVGPFRLPALLSAKSCGSVPACDLSVSTASVSIAFHSPVDRVPLFALATTDQWPDLLFEDNVINPQVSLLHTFVSQDRGLVYFELHATGLSVLEVAGRWWEDVGVGW